MAASGPGPGAEAAVVVPVGSRATWTTGLAPASLVPLTELAAEVAVARPAPVPSAALAVLAASSAGGALAVPRRGALAERSDSTASSVVCFAAPLPWGTAFAAGWGLGCDTACGSKVVLGAADCGIFTADAAASGAAAGCVVVGSGDARNAATAGCPGAESLQECSGCASCASAMKRVDALSGRRAADGWPAPGSVSTSKVSGRSGASRIEVRARSTEANCGRISWSHMARLSWESALICNKQQRGSQLDVRSTSAGAIHAPLGQAGSAGRGLVQRMVTHLARPVPERRREDPDRVRQTRELFGLNRDGQPAHREQRETVASATPAPELQGVAETGPARTREQRNRTA